MNCACMVEYDGDCCEIIAEQLLTTWKDRTCDECRRDIMAGERYLYERYETPDGERKTHRTCETCDSIREHMTCGFIYGDLLSDLEDAIRDNGCDASEDCLARLTPKARALVCDIIEECWDELEED